MFKATRDSILGFGTRLGASWRDLRGRGMVRLFLFEFAVVLLGVLAAQGLANWAREREADAEMLLARDALESQLAGSYATARIWDAALPCLEAKVTEIATLASNEQVLSARIVTRPVLYSRAISPLGEENALRLSRTVGAERFEHYNAMVDHVNRIDAMSQAIAAEWIQFSRVEPSMGRVREGDILAARDAAARIRSNLRSIGISTNAIDVAGRELGITPVMRQFDGQRVLPLADCSELDELGAIYRLE